MDTAHFDLAAAKWDENPARRELADAIAAGIRRYISVNPPARMLDFGCGTGNISIRLADVAGEVLAVDSSSGMTDEFSRKLEQLPELREKITVQHAEFPDLSLVGRGFDLICLSMVLHHVEDHAGLLKKLVGYLTPGGKIAIADIYAEDGQFHQDMTVPHNGFNPQDIVEILADANCGEITFREVHKLHKPVKDGTMRDFPIFLLIASR